MILEETNEIGPSSLNLPVREDEFGFYSEAADSESVLPTYGVTLAGQERRLLVHALDRADGNQTKAAGLLGITRDAIRYKMKKYNLQ